MAISVIDKAKELIEEVGTEKAIEFFQKRIDEIGEPKDFLIFVKYQEAKLL